MARKPMPWFRLYTEMPTDRKIRRLAVEHRWLWVCVMCAARQSPVEGWLLVSEDEALTTDDLADISGLKARQVDAGLKAFLKLGMLENDVEVGAFRVAAWSTRQRQSDTSTDRVRAWRSARKQASTAFSNDVVTVSNGCTPVAVTAMETRQKTEQETEQDSLYPSTVRDELADALSDLTDEAIGAA